MSFTPFLYLQSIINFIDSLKGLKIEQYLKNKKVKKRQQLHYNRATTSIKD